MSIKNNPQQELDTYKKRQRMMPFVIGALAILLVVAGIIILVISVSGGFAPKPTATLPPTLTNTVLPPTQTPVPATNTVTPTITPTLTATATLTPVGPFEYTVLANDTCWDLAVKFKVDLAVLLALNNFPAGTCPIQPNAKIMIPAPGQTLPSPTAVDLTRIAPNTIINYTVQSGDSLRAIAIKFNSTQDAILKLNPTIKDGNLLYVGDVIKVPVNIATPVPTLAPTSTAATRLPSATATVTPTKTP